MLGKEEAVFVPSGTMANQISVRLHCSPGDEMICEAGSHLYNYEQGAFAQLSGVVAKPIPGDDYVLKLEHLLSEVRPEDDHFARTRLVCLENTHNRGGGRVHPYDDVVKICEFAHAHGIRCHLDGARLFNAVIASGRNAREWCRHFDTVSVCFSKGLGAPIGSAVAGNSDDIKRARRHRKMLGGGMRQVGVIAAAALFAIDHHIDRLAEDHAHAKLLAQTLRGLDGVRVTPELTETNIVFWDLDDRWPSAKEVVHALSELGVKVLAEGDRTLRAVTHLGIRSDAAEYACDALRHVLGSKP